MVEAAAYEPQAKQPGLLLECEVLYRREVPDSFEEGKRREGSSLGFQELL